MYSETVKSDKKDFLIVMIAAALCIGAVWIIRLLIKNLLICDIITFAVIGIIAYKTLVGCCSEFTYSVNNENILLSRRISSRNKHIKINKSDIVGIYLNKPQNFRTSADFYKTFAKSGRCFIVYKSGDIEKTAIFEPSDTFVENMSVLGYSVT